MDLNFSYVCIHHAQSAPDPGVCYGGAILPEGGQYMKSCFNGGGGGGGGWGCSQ